MDLDLGSACSGLVVKPCLTLLHVSVVQPNSTFLVKLIDDMISDVPVFLRNAVINA